jgi:hypothetical protein
LFRRLLNAMVLNFVVVYRQSTDHLKFSISWVEQFSVKQAVQHKVSGHHGSDNTIEKLTECHLPRRIPPTERNVKQQDSVIGSNMTKQENLCVIVRMGFLSCASVVVLRLIQGKLSEVM